jgi:3-oxoacyl-[acyl-carrier protein] reductase
MMQQDSGIIVNLTGGGFARPNLGGSAYGSSKAGVIRVTDTLAEELRREGYNILVYGIDPGFVKGGMTKLLAESKSGRRWLPHVKEGLEAGRDNPAEDVGAAISRLIQISPPELTGRVFSYRDNIEALVKRAGEIQEQELYQLRYHTFKS